MTGTVSGQGGAGRSGGQGAQGNYFGLWISVFAISPRGCARLWKSHAAPVFQGVCATGSRGGPSPAGAGYDAASEIEAQLGRPGTGVSTDVLFPSQPAPVVRSHVHELRLRHVCHGGLLRWSRVEARGLRRADTRRRACEPGRLAGSGGRPVRAPLGIVADGARLQAAIHSNRGVLA